MKENLRQAFRSGLLRRVLPLILAVALAPLAVLVTESYIGFITLRDMAATESYNALTTQALQALELRAVDLSVRVASFLKEREEDLLQLAAQEPSAETYIAFSKAKRGTLWTPGGKFDIPLYKEIAFVDTTGREVIRIVDEQAMAESALRDVSRPENTEYKRETYFAEGMKLGPGEVYVQRLMGWYLPKGVAYAHAENPHGQRYQGVVRFVTPVYENGEKKGLLVLSLDWTNVMELVAHVVGSEEGYLAEIPLDPETGKLRQIYSYLVGDDGWTLYHARNYAIVGLDEKGEYVPPLNGKDVKEQAASGLMPVNANELGFLDATVDGKFYPHPWPRIAEQNRNGVDSGYVPVYLNKDGVPKAMAWATVHYYTPPYNTPAGFGWVGISIDAQKFHEAPNALKADIEERVTRALAIGDLVLIAVTLAAVLLISYLIYRMIARPVGEMLALARRIAGGDLTPVDGGALDPQSKNELVQLQIALIQMLENLRDIITGIRRAALQIGSSAEEVKATLQEQAGAASQSASAVAETTSTMEEMAIIAAQIADRAQAVVEDAAETQQMAQSGAQAVADTVAKLDEIRRANESNVQEILTLGRRSRRIGEVMELIDNIAARTRLIAFNAALEAAAAGESGQRFSIVAMEVRRLADNVVESTGEIRERIDEIQAAANALVLASEQEAKRIAEGVSRGREARRSLDEILESAESTTIAAEQISLSTRQQRTAAEQVVDAARSIQRDSQAVAQGSSQAAIVIADLAQLAADLQRIVAQFQMGEAATAGEVQEGAENLS